MSFTLRAIFEKMMAQDGDRPAGAEVIQSDADGSDKGCIRSQYGSEVRRRVNALFWQIM